jgi:hypothetical protein
MQKEIITTVAGLIEKILEDAERHQPHSIISINMISFSGEPSVTYNLDARTFADIFKIIRCLRKQEKNKNH